MQVKKYPNGFELRIHPEVLDYPLKIKESKMIFVNSMSDLFHEKLSFNFINEIFNIMEKANWHKYQILTKRSKKLKEFGKKYGKFPDNVWIGVSVENSLYKKKN
jgi:protein gp37